MDIHHFAEQNQLPQRDTGQSALPTEDKSVNWKQSSSNTHNSEQKQSLLLKSLTTKEMYLKAIQEMYPEAIMCLLSSNLAIYEDWDNVRTVASLKAFTAVRKVITEKKLDNDNRTSLSDDEDSDGSCASYMQKKPKKTSLHWSQPNRQFWHYFQTGVGGKRIPEGPRARSRLETSKL
jgi:hypothetical protein